MEDRHDKIIQLLEDLDYYRNLFFKGQLHENEVPFLRSIIELDINIKNISSSKERTKVKNFVNSIKSHKNFKIAITAYNKKKAQEEKFNKEEKEREIQKQKIQFEKQQEQLKYAKVISEINKLLQLQEYPKAFNLFSQYQSDLYEHTYNQYVKIKNKNDIYDIIQTRKISHLIHFTDINNLESILKYGILSRNDLEKGGISYYATDKDRFDNRPDCTSFSIEYPNYKMLYQKMVNNSKRAFAIIVLPAENVLLNDLKKYYVYNNAASPNAIYMLEGDELTKARYLNNMFNMNINTIIREPNIPSNFTTDPQAEILINGTTSPKEIREIHFKTQDDYDIFYNHLTDKNLIKGIKLNVSSYYYNNRNMIKE